MSVRQPDGATITGVVENVYVPPDGVLGADADRIKIVTSATAVPSILIGVFHV